MKSKAHYTKEQFSVKIKMTDEVWDDMDDEMLSKVDEFEKHLSSKAWAMFFEYLNVHHTSLIAEIPYVRPVKR